VFGNRVVGEYLEQGTGRIFEKGVLGEYLEQGTGRRFEKYWENTWNRAQGVGLRTGYWENM
jgi:hypothetical protein